MDISKQLNEIIHLLRDSSFSNYISILSLLVAIIAIVVNIVSSYKNHKQYLESIKPLLSFELYESNGELLLAIKNTGKTEAKDIKIDIHRINNNGDNNNLCIDELFKNSFMLYPTEEIQGVVAYSGEIRSKYSRNQLSKIEDSIESLSYSNNRIANYIEGKTLFRFDKLNVFPHNSLYKDMKDAFNNVERSEEKFQNSMQTNEKGRTGRHRTECKVAVCPSLAGVALATTALPPVSNRGTQIRLGTVSKFLQTLIL